MNIENELKVWASEFIQVRHHIHRNPELGFEEYLTKELIISHLKEYGIEAIYTDFGGTGVVGVIKGELGEGKMIGLRADMDALPISEENNFGHHSRNQGKMHACGHDGHTSMLLLAAKYLAQKRQFKGTAIVIFQPAEEGLGGAEKMISDGILKRFPLDACYALHNMPGIPAGEFAFKEGAIMASSDRLFVTVKGQSGHAGLPHLTKDPLLVITNIYQAIQGVVSRFHDPFDPIVVSVTQIHCGETTNVISDEAYLNGTFRTLSVSTRNKLVRQLSQLVYHIAEAYGLSAEFKLGPISHPPTINTANEVSKAVLAAKNIVGEEKVNASCEAKLTSEDFAFFLEKVPGCYGFIGNGKYSDNSHIGLHNNKYDFNDDILHIGASYFVQLMKNND